MPRGVSILALSPRWIELPERYGVGISIDCPTHGEFCRLKLYFRTPGDGFPPVRGVPLLQHFGPHDRELSLAEITIYGEGLDHLIRIPRHWSGYIVEGELHTVSPLLLSEDDIPTDPLIPTVNRGEDA